MTLSRVTVVLRSPEREQMTSFDGATVRESGDDYVIHDSEGRVLGTYKMSEYTIAITTVKPKQP